MSGNNGGNAEQSRCNLVFLGLRRVVGQVHSCEVDVLIGGVVELDPVVSLAEFVGCHRVAGTYLVDYDWRGAGCHKAFGLQGLEDGSQFGIFVCVELKDVFAADNRCARSDIVGYLCVPIDIGGAGHVVVHLDCNDVLALLEEVYGQFERAGIWIVGSISGGIGLEGDFAFWQEVATGFRSVDIDHEAIVGSEVERY